MAACGSVTRDRVANAELDPVAYASAVTESERRLRLVALVGLVAIVGAVLVGVVLRLSQEIFVGAAGILGLGVLTARLTLWRCPACRAQLPGRSGSRICPGCDRPLPDAQS
jgi:hypothetical protein